MATVIVLGAGISGHTAAAFLRKKLSKKHQVIVIAPNSYYQWIPSNIWVDVGRMTIDQVRFKLAPRYRKAGIEFHQARDVSIHPEGNDAGSKAFVKAIYTNPEKQGKAFDLEYDFLVNATGPKLNFDATEGLGPQKTRFQFVPMTMLHMPGKNCSKPLQKCKTTKG